MITLSSVVLVVILVPPFLVKFGDMEEDSLLNEIIWTSLIKKSPITSRIKINVMTPSSMSRNLIINFSFMVLTRTPSNSHCDPPRR